MTAATFRESSRQRRGRPGSSTRATGPAALVLLGLLTLAACRSAPPELTSEERARTVQGLLVRGTAQAEIKDWEAARELFEEATVLAPEEPAAVFDLALAHLRLGSPQMAAEWLERIDEEAPAEVRARAGLLRGRLALEAGDAQAEAAAYRQAAELDPEEPTYPYALSQVLPRLGLPETADEMGRLLRRSQQSWPDNSRLRAELALWLLERPDIESRRQGLALLEELVAAARRPELEALVARGRETLATDGPRVLRRALNLVRPGKRFQKDSADLEARLQVIPYDEPLGESLRLVASRSAAEPAVHLVPTELVPPLPLAAGEKLLRVVASNDAVEDPGGRREADLTFLTNRALWFLGRAATEHERIAAVAIPEGGDLVVGELDGDGWMEVAAFGPSGVRLFGREEAAGWTERDLPAELAGADLRHPLLLDFEHDGDLDLLAVDARGGLTLVTHRGEAGWGRPMKAPLPIDAARGPLLATDLDGDADQDLVVARDGDLAVLVNWRQGEFTAAATLPLEAAADRLEPVDRLVALDWNTDGRFDLAATVGGRLALWRNEPDLGLVADEEAVTAAGASPLSLLAVGDLDLDGDPDLVAAAPRGPEPGADLLVWPSGRGFPSPANLVSIEGVHVDEALFLDLDADQAPDLLAWGPQGVLALRASGAGEQLRLRVGLRGLAGKVPLDGRGAKVLVSWGIDERVLEIERPEILLGLGERPPALIKITWPNGISEYLHQPEPGRRHLVEQVLRIEGSCPFLYASDGRQKRFVTDILGLAPLGMLASPGVYVEPDPEEYLRLPDWVEADGGFYRLSITEELREVAYLDQTELVAIDTPDGVVAYNGERWVEPPVQGLDLKLLAPLDRPTSVLDDRGAEALALVAEADHRYLTNHREGRLYQGAAPPHSLTIELPAGLAKASDPVLVLFGWLHWGNTSVNVARGQDPQGAPLFPLLEVPDGRGGWRSTEIAVGLPAGKTKPLVIELGGVVDPLDPRVRLTTDFEVYWDRIAVSEKLPAATTHRRHAIAPTSARLGYGGFSRWYRPAANGPYLFDYADRLPVPRRGGPEAERVISWSEHRGFYTAYGAVTDRLRGVDDRLVILGSGEELLLEFDARDLLPLAAGWRRTLFLHTEGWEKDGDPNVACAETVKPLPFRGMARYPCPSGDESVGLEPPAPSSGAEQSRWVDAERLDRRVRAWSRSATAAARPSAR